MCWGVASEGGWHLGKVHALLEKSESHDTELRSLSRCKQSRDGKRGQASLAAQGEVGDGSRYPGFEN